MARSRSGRLARLGASVGVLAFAATGCTVDGVEDALRFGWPRGITAQAESMRQLWTWSTVAALVVGVFVWGLMFWTVAFHRKKRNDKDLPRQTAENLPLEWVYTAIPFVIITVLFYFTVVSQNFVMDKTGKPDVSIAVTGFKWNWQFTYQDVREDESGDLVSTIGSTTEIPILVLPAGEKIRFELHSNDVIHSFWVPEFLFKLDVIPGQDKAIGPDGQKQNVFLIDLDEGSEGAYVGRCAELCGIYHAQMNFEVRVVSPEKYDAYIEARQNGDSTAAALESIGESGTATSTRPFDPSRTQATSGD